MAIVQSEFGGIEIMEDFLGPEWIILETAATGALGPFRVIGDGVGTNTDSGVITLESDGLSGIAQLTTTDEASKCTGLATAKCFDVALMGTLVMEVRVRLPNLDTKSIFLGFCDENDDAETAICVGSTTTVTLTASDLCGFLFDHSFTGVCEDDWHMVFNGGTTTGETDGTAIDADKPAIATEFDVLRVEIDPDGTARWLVNGVLKQTQAGAVSTTTDLAAVVLLQADGAAIETADLDYILVKASRNWTV